MSRGLLDNRWLQLPHPIYFSTTLSILAASTTLFILIICRFLHSFCILLFIFSYSAPLALLSMHPNVSYGLTVYHLLHFLPLTTAYGFALCSMIPCFSFLLLHMVLLCSTCSAVPVPKISFGFVSRSIHTYSRHDFLRSQFWCFTLVWLPTYFVLHFYSRPSTSALAS